MELTAHALSSAASLATIAATLGGSAAIMAGKLPRAGPLRAFALGISSRFYGSRFKGAAVS